MLQHQPSTVKQVPTPAERRVTPEELAKALAAVEARKEQSARERESTIPIGEAVQQLGFDATPEQIWTEVQAERAKVTRKGERRRWGVWPMAYGLLLLIAGAIGRLGQDISSTQDQPLQDQPSSNAPLQVIVPSTPQTIIKTLAEIPNNGTFYCDEDTAHKLLQHTAEADKILVTEGHPYTGQQNDASWDFTKHIGKLYVHGYTAPRSTEAMQLGHVSIYNEPVDATGTGGYNNSQPITLAIGTFHIDSFDADDYGAKRMIVSAIHPDVHFGDHG